MHGDRHQLCQVFTNLLINAFEALGGRGSIGITAEQGTLEGDHTTRRARADPHGASSR